MALHVSTAMAVAVEASSAIKRHVPSVTSGRTLRTLRTRRNSTGCTFLHEQVRQSHDADPLQHVAHQIVDPGDVDGTLHATVTTGAARTPYLPALPVQQEVQELVQ